MIKDVEKFCEYLINFAYSFVDISIETWFKGIEVYIDGELITPDNGAFHHLLLVNRASTDDPASKGLK